MICGRLKTRNAIQWDTKLLFL